MFAVLSRGLGKHILKKNYAVSREQSYVKQKVCIEIDDFHHTSFQNSLKCASCKIV